MREVLVKGLQVGFATSGVGGDVESDDEKFDFFITFRAMLDAFGDDEHIIFVEFNVAVT